MAMENSEYWLHEFERQQTDLMHRMEVQVSLGQGALKSMMLVNGAAIISLLTFIGNKGSVADAEALKWAFALFGAGLFTGLLAYFGAYLSQAEYMQFTGHRMVFAQSKMSGGEGVEVPQKYEIRGTRLLIGAIVCVMSSLFLFGSGLIAALNGVL